MFSIATAPLMQFDAGYQGGTHEVSANAGLRKLHKTADAARRYRRVLTLSHLPDQGVVAR